MTQIIRWRQIQRKNFTQWRALVEFLQLDEKNQGQILKAAHFPLNLPRRLAEKVEKNCLEDPILRQFVPLQEELKVVSGFCADPVSDGSFQEASRFLHKYPGRALLLCTGSCAMHCRYCFRQNFPYAKGQAVFGPEFELIREDTSLEEIILSGGDPLSLSDAVLQDLLERLSSITHIKRIRFHTRFPIGIPERIDDSFVHVLESIRAQIIFVVHINHARELDEDVVAGLKRVQKLGIPVLNQAVLLKGVNDNLATLKALFEALVNNGILPYYLHQLDRVQGAAHFEVEEAVGLQLMEGLRGCLSGYAVPQYVREIAGKSSKTPIF